MSQVGNEILLTVRDPDAWQPTAGAAAYQELVNQASTARSQSGTLREQAATKLQLARKEMDRAARLENDAARLGYRAGNLELQAAHNERTADRLEIPTFSREFRGAAYTDNKAIAGLKESAADRLEDDMTSLRHQAADARIHAQQLQYEATELEKAAFKAESQAHH
jgi:hypothetical protein